MPIRREKIDMVAFHIHRQESQALNGVNAKQDALFLAERADAVEIRAEPAVAFHRTDRNESRPRIHLFNQIVKQHPPFDSMHHAGFDSQAFQVPPGINICWKLDVGDDHIVAGLPIQSVSNNGKTFGSVFDESHLIRSGVDETGKTLPGLFDPSHPGFVMGGSKTGGIINKGRHNFTHPFGQRGYPCMIEKNQLLRHRKLFSDIFNIQNQTSPGHARWEYRNSSLSRDNSLLAK